MSERIEKEIYNEPMVGYRLTEIDADEPGIGGKNIRFYYTQGDPKKIQFEIWLRDFTEVHGALIESIKREFNDDRFLPKEFGEVKRLEAENARLREALEHYANEEIWGRVNDNSDLKSFYANYQRSGFEVAKKVLEEE